MALLPDLPSPTIEAIYAAYETSQGTGFREHLGASVIGHECERHLWYAFRWVRRAQHAGRILRLFETGQLEEARLIKNLRATGVTVLEVDPDTGRQWAVKGCDGHFGGSCDGVAIGLHEAPKAYHALEFKTHNTKSFNALQKHGLAKSKPQHMAQLQVYMNLLGLERGFYLAVCKDDDRLYSERVRPDLPLVTRLLEKAQRVISSVRPPAKISEEPDFYICKFCDYRGICQYGMTPVERNCRTCLHSTPLDSGLWGCATCGGLLSRKHQLSGCMTSHRFIPDLIPGEQVDVRDGAIVYRMPDGEEWVDEGR